ncbi:replication protein A 32 kDa subunit-like isoform X1 [Micropterus salmoides]|uniref:replication protein A 32 kDa subunit-like isoform X1 n=1 Tax=Micropterus salmoides TaxID=27706 RepID=UPI0018EBF7E7|nr:replication protein A 32 kDa subunit-like isoform X1 [Micropterus salmoides]
MWNQACSQSPVGVTSHKAVISKRAALHILPCTVSQLLSASQVSNDTFAVCNWELNQVSIVGLLRGFAPFVTNIQYSVDDMTGPPLNVKQWVNATEDCALTFASPGVYVKVTGTLRSFNGQRSLMAMNIYCLKDPNEITSHMLEVVQAHMQIFRKAFDVNMNTTASSLSGGLLGHSGGGHPVDILPNGLSTIQEQVLHVIKRFSVRDDGISFQDLKTQLDYLSTKDLRTSLAFLINEGHVFSTIDEHHFKSSEP